MDDNISNSNKGVSYSDVCDFTFTELGEDMMGVSDLFADQEIQFENSANNTVPVEKSNPPIIEAISSDDDDDEEQIEVYLLSYCKYKDLWPVRRATSEEIAENYGKGPTSDDQELVCFFHWNEFKWRILPKDPCTKHDLEAYIKYGKHPHGLLAYKAALLWAETASKVFTVEAVLDRRISMGIVEYYVKWEGYPDSDNTWEPIKSFDDKSLIEEYDAAHPFPNIKKRRSIEKEEVKVVQKVEKKYKFVKKKEEDSSTSESSSSESDSSDNESSESSEEESSSGSDESSESDSEIVEQKTVKITIQKSYHKRRKKGKINLPIPSSPTSAVLSNFPAFSQCLDLYQFPPHPQYLALFYAMVCERQSIAYKKEVMQEPEPWTQSETFATHNFINVQRELDPGTKYFQRQIREIDSPKTILSMAIVYRLVNKINTFETSPFKGIPPPNKFLKFFKWMKDCKDKGNPMFTGAHQVVGYATFEKTILFLDSVKYHKLAENILTVETKREMCKLLRQIPGVGNFFAWQICSDLVESKACTATEEEEYIMFGPGSTGGLKIIFPSVKGKTLLPAAQDLFHHQNAVYNALKLEFKEVEPRIYNKENPLSLKNVEHSLCEFFRYVRTVVEPHKRAKNRRSGTPKTQTVVDKRVKVYCEKLETDPIGTVRFMGTVDEEDDEVWVGVELDEAVDIGTDGTYKEKRYFECEMGKAIFIPCYSISPLEDDDVPLIVLLEQEIKDS